MTNVSQDKSSIFNSLARWIESREEPLEGVVYFMMFFLGAIFISLSLTFFSVLLCIWLVVDAASQISQLLASFLTFILLIIAIVAIYWDRVKGLPLSYVQKLIPILAFIQTFFWVINPQNPIHEPRSVFLLAISVALAYYDTQLNNLSASLLSVTKALQTRLKERYAPETPESTETLK
jgi:hypothetical protein